MSLFRGLKTPTLANTGSTARDHLASERTFLAWIRTGLGFIALGMAVERFSRLDLDEFIAQLGGNKGSQATQAGSTMSNYSATSSSTSEKVSKTDKTDVMTRSPERFSRDTSLSSREHLLVGMLLGTGGGSILYAITRYFSNLRSIQRGLFKPAFLGAAGLGMAVTGLSAGVYWTALEREQSKTSKTRSTEQ